MYFIKYVLFLYNLNAFSFQFLHFWNLYVSYYSNYYSLAYKPCNRHDLVLWWSESEMWDKYFIYVTGLSWREWQVMIVLYIIVIKPSWAIRKTTVRIYIPFKEHFNHCVSLWKHIPPPPITSHHLSFLSLTLSEVPPLS